MAGRRLGKFYQFFLNLGTSTNADQAIVVSREVYRQGVGGMWIQYLVLFLTPFYWFTTAFFRRVRLVTIGDFFTERFKSKFLGGAFAVFTLFMALLGNGVGYMVAAKTMMALTPKPAAKYTVQEKASVDLFNEYRALQVKADKAELDAGRGGPPDRARRAAEERRAQGLHLLHRFRLHLSHLHAHRRDLHHDGRVHGRGHHRRHPGLPPDDVLADAHPHRPPPHRRLRRAPRRGPGLHVQAVRVVGDERVRLVHHPGHGPGQPRLHHRRGHGHADGRLGQERDDRPGRA